MKKILCSALVLSTLALPTTVFATDKTDNSILEGVTSYVNEVYVNLNEEEKDILIDKLYNEKSDVLNDTYSNKKQLTEAKISMMVNDIARIDDEENYIVNLINSQGKDTDLSNWEFNLEYLQNNYDSLKSVSGFNKNYVDSYIEAYTIVELTKDMPDEKVNTITTLKYTTDAAISMRASTANYSYSNALSYAEKYYKNYNKNYPDWSSSGGDCANFVSQCLYAGGKAMKGIPGNSSSAESFSNWFSSGTSQNTKNVSSTWRGADAFKWYWMDHSESYKKFTAVDSTSWNYGYTGDAISLLNSNGRAMHTMLITGYNNPDFILSAHTSSTNSASLKSKIKGYDSFIIYNMRN